MSQTDDDKPAPRVSRSGSPGSIGKELGEDLDFEADALLDSLLSEVPPPAKETARPEAALVSEPPPSAGRVLHTPSKREFPDDEPTWVGNLDAATALELQRLADQAKERKTAEVVPPAPQALGAPEIPVLPPPPAFSPPRPGSVPRPATAPRASRPGAAAPTPKPAPSPPHAAPEPPRRELPAFPEEDEVTRVQSMPTLRDIEGFLERSAQASPNATTARPPAAVQEANIQTSAQEIEDLSMEEAGIVENLPSSSVAAAATLSELSFEEATDGIDELLREPGEARLSLAGAAELSDAEIEALAAAELGDVMPSEPSQPPLSYTPPPPEAEGATSMWPDERPASAHLAADSARWAERAEWLEGEANAAGDPIAKSRALLVASEIWALVGDLPRAREVAMEASTMARSLPLVARQLRALAAAEQDWKTVTTALDLEIRGAATPEARAHAAYLSAEVHRIALKDEATSKKKLELALRASSDDPRAHLAKLVEQLGKSPAPARARWPESVALAELAQATEESARLRGAPTPAGAPSSTVSPSLALEQARRAFTTGERGPAASLVARLAEIEGIGSAALWLAASLSAHEQKTRSESMGWLERLLGGDSDTPARRALAARAIEQGSREGLAAASEGENEAFSALDRAVLGALSGEGLETLGPLADELAKSASERPLAAAIHGALSSHPSADALPFAPAAQSAQGLGLALAPPPGVEATGALAHLRAAEQRFADANPDHPLSAALQLRFAISDKRAPALLRAVTLLGDGDPSRARDENSSSALIEELTSNQDAAMERYQAASEADRAAPLALRALLTRTDRDGAVRLLTSAAETADDRTQSALYFLEAALRLGPEEPERYDELLHKAADALPGLSLIHRLGEQQARARGDGEKLLGWLRARRRDSDDGVETALDLVREALLVAEQDAALAASLLEDAVMARPSDIALRELHERLALSQDEERAAWREQLAERADDDTRRELYAQAALEHRRAGHAEETARAAQAAAELGASELLRVLSEESMVGTPAAARISEKLLAQVRGTEDTAELCELYGRLEKLDRARGDHSSALLWHRAILERSPEHLPALRRVEHHYIGKSRLEELEPIAARLTTLTSGGEADAHARLAARIRVRRGAWSSVAELVKGALTQNPPRLWALRMLEAQARAADDSATTLAVTQQLLTGVERPADQATLLLRGAEAAARLEQLEQAQLLLERALALVPDHQVVLTTLAEVLEARGDFRAAARALESLAEASAVDAHRVSAWHQAGVLWQDKGGDPERACAALEKAVALELANDDAVLRLQGLYVASGEREKLAALLERRLSRTTDPEERVALEVARGRALADVGERAQAKAALAAALDADPDHVEALSAFAELCVAEGDWSAAEHAYIRLVRHLPEPSRQAQIYRQLGELYDTSLPNPERAELAYREVLKREPEDEGAVSRLIQALGRRGMGERAVELSADFLARATTPEAKRQRTLSLALVIEQLGGDRKKAEALLEKTRKESPLDHSVLRALVELHLRAGEQRAATVLLDRAAADARRALATGRFDPALFEMLAAVAELRGTHDAASLATATLMALSGEDVPVQALGQAAGDIRLDEQLAPDLITPALRALLKKAGEVLDAAYPVDLRAIKASPLPAASQAFVAFVQNVAQSFGLFGLEVLTSPALGPVCLPVSTSPPIIVFGQALLDHTDDAARFFLLMRSLKILQGRAASLSRTPPIELPAVVSAFLSLFANNWAPQGVDAKKLADARARIEQVLRGRLDDDVPVLVLEVIGSLGNRVSQLGTAIHQWGDRTGLLAVGSPNAALRGLALAAGQLGGPPTGPDRVKWVIRNPEARDLAVFSVSEAYAEARARLGVR
jgi:cellulose synthase operon protein C